VDIVNAYFTAEDGSFYSSDKRHVKTGSFLRETEQGRQSKTEHVNVFKRRQYFSDGELLASNSVMLEVIHSIWLRTGDNVLSNTLLDAENTIKSRFDINPFDNLYAGKVITEISLGSTENQQYFALGNGYVDFNHERRNCDSPANIKLTVKLKEGWHMNSANPNNQYLIPTRLTSDVSLVNVNYPKDTVSKLSFSKKALRVYQGAFEIHAQAKTRSSSKLTLDLQACGDKLCLAPQSISFVLPECR
jgi:hypothetical protein